jgi:hypothetical protein
MRRCFAFILPIFEIIQVLVIYRAMELKGPHQADLQAELQSIYKENGWEAMFDYLYANQVKYGYIMEVLPYINRRTST